jgi:CheY-like chemotaxis protein
MPVAKDGMGENILPNSVASDSGLDAEDQAITTLLYIEDNPDYIQTMRATVQQWPEFSLIVRKSAAKGIKAVSMLQPDLILMSLQLGDMDGQEILLKVKDNTEMAKIPVVGLSADTLPATKQKYLDFGLAFFEEKPIESKRLRIALDES